MKLITSMMTALVLFALSSFAAATAQGLETGTLTIETEAGEQVFDIEIAGEPALLSRLGEPRR